MTFLLRRKLPTTAACVTGARRVTAISATANHATAMSRLTRLFFAVLACLGPSVSVHAQEFSSAQLQFRPVAAARQDTESTVGPNADTTIIRTNAQVLTGRRGGEDDADFVIRTDPPGPERLFSSRKSEAMIREVIRRDATVRSGPERVLFPEYPPEPDSKYPGRNYPQSSTKVEVSYVCHGRLYFEQKNFERAGWDLGYLSPLANVGMFYYDTVLLPYHAWTDPCRHYDCSAGKCLPGDRTPLYLYREPFSVSGLAAQTLFLGGGFFIFP
jgi:hypothetical protein